MKQIVWIINCYLYGATLILLVVLALLVYLRGQANHLPNPFARRNIVYRPKEKAQGVLLGKKFGLMAYSPEQDEGHILVMGPSGTGKTSALLIPTLRSWQGTALVVDISGDISANVQTENKIIFDPTAADCIPYDVFASIDAAPDDTERQERLEQLAYLLLPDKANDSEAGVFFTKNGRKMITAALICYYGMGWGFIEICEFFLGHDWRSLLNDIAKQENTAANAYISSFAGASEQNTAGCKQSADDALKLFATNSKIKNALRKVPTYEKSICPATLEQNSIYIFIPDEKLKIYGDLLRIITAQSMEYWTVPRFILQPLVENSILHGTADEDDFVTITVRATVSENLLTIHISDTGCGFDPSAIKEKNSERFSGIGLSNVDERMRLHYGNEYGLTIESAPGIGTQCILRIPNEAIR